MKKKKKTVNLVQVTMTPATPKQLRMNVNSAEISGIMNKLHHTVVRTK